MGLFQSKDWAEVDRLGSPDNQQEMVASRRDGGGDGTESVSGSSILRHRRLNNDPRSVSDEVERTPIQDSVKEDRQRAWETPTAAGSSSAPKNSKVFKVPVVQDVSLLSWVKTYLKYCWVDLFRFQLTIDPRSPSNVPRTPILVQQQSREKTEEECSTPRGDVDRVPSKVAPIARGASVPTAKLKFCDEDEENVVAITASSKISRMNPDDAYRSPLLIEGLPAGNIVDPNAESDRNDLPEKNEPSAKKGSGKKVSRKVLAGIENLDISDPDSALNSGTPLVEGKQSVGRDKDDAEGDDQVADSSLVI